MVVRTDACLDGGLGAALFTQEGQVCVQRIAHGRADPGQAESNVMRAGGKAGLETLAALCSLST